MDDLQDFLPQAQDRITSILADRAASMPRSQPPAMPQQMPEAVPQQQQMRPLDMLKVKIASGDPQANMLAKRVQMFAGNDPSAQDSAMQFMIDHPNEIDPSNSFQTNTALAQWSKQSGFNDQHITGQPVNLEMPTNQQISMQDLGNIASGKGTNFLGLQQNAAQDIAKIQLEQAKTIGGASDGTTMQVYKMLKQQYPEMDDMTALRIAQNKVGTNLQIDPRTGAVSDMTGAANGLGNLKYGEKTGELNAELGLKPKIEGNVEIAKVKGKAQADAMAGLGKAEDDANMIEQNVSSLLSHPGRKTALGVQSYIPSRRGSDAWNFENRLSQVNSGAFLEAYNRLKGGGSITEVEGQKGTQAISRMQVAQSDAEFQAAADDLLKVVETARNRARQQASGNFGSNNVKPEPAAKTGGVLHQDAKGNKAIVYPDGSYEEVP